MSITSITRRAVKLSDESGSAGDINDNADPTALTRAPRGRQP